MLVLAQGNFDAAGRFHRKMKARPEEGQTCPRVVPEKSRFLSRAEACFGWISPKVARGIEGLRYRHVAPVMWLRGHVLAKSPQPIGFQWAEGCGAG